MGHDTYNTTCNLETAFRFEPKGLAYELQAIGYDGLAERCFSRLSADESRSFGERLIKLAAWLRRQFGSLPQSEKPKGAGHGFVYDAERDRWQATIFTPFDEMVKTIETGGKWFKGQYTP